MNEIQEFHPLVAAWLLEHNYSFKHHVCLPDGIADFMAIHNKTGEVLAIECKCDGSEKRGKFFAQVLDYSRQIENSIPAVAIPSQSLNKRVKEICRHYGIKIIPIKCEVSNDTVGNQTGDTNPIAQLGIQRIVFISNLMLSIDNMIENIISNHVEHGSNPILDLMILFQMAMATNPEVYSEEQRTRVGKSIIDAIVDMSSYFSEDGSENNAIFKLLSAKGSYVLSNL